MARRTRRTKNFQACAVVTLILASTLGLVAPTSATTKSSQRWPRFLDAGKVLATPPAVRKPLPFGTVVANTQLDGSGGPKSVMFVNHVGWSLGYVGNFEYPLTSSNHGLTWHVGGHWFAYAAADGAAFTSAIKPFHPNVAGGAPTFIASYFVGEPTFYLTWNGGRQWHAIFMPGNIVKVVQLNGGTAAAPPLQFFVVEVKSYAAPFVTRYYSSSDEGRHWSRSRGQPVIG